MHNWSMSGCVFFFQEKDGIRVLVRSRGLGDVYKRQVMDSSYNPLETVALVLAALRTILSLRCNAAPSRTCLLYTSDAADERSSVDLGGRRIIKKKKQQDLQHDELITKQTM